MASGDVYRAKAAEIMGKAARETNHDQNRANLHALAQSYLRLAEQADRNELTDVTYETPTPRPGTNSPNSATTATTTTAATTTAATAAKPVGTKARVRN